MQRYKTAQNPVSFDSRRGLLIRFLWTFEVDLKHKPLLYSLTPIPRRALQTKRKEHNLFTANSQPSFFKRGHMFRITVLKLSWCWRRHIFTLQNLLLRNKSILPAIIIVTSPILTMSTILLVQTQLKLAKYQFEHFAIY